MSETPARFGRYEVSGVLGSGGFATVYRGRDPLLGREVAIKALHPHIAADETARRRFLAEARVLAHLRQPHVVAVYDVGEEGERPYFVMELLAGETLAARLARSGPLALSEAAPILADLAGAIDALHAAGVVHRDVTAANVMLTPDGRAVLMDLGIAIAAGRTRLTRGYGLGTPESAAPEQIRNESVGPAADIYALGVLAYELLAGRPPFSGDTAHVLYAQAHLPPPSLLTLRPDLPAAVATTIAAALAKEPAERPPSARAFVAPIVAAASDAPSPVAPSIADGAQEFAGDAGRHELPVRLAAGFTTVTIALEAAAEALRLFDGDRELARFGPLVAGYRGTRACLLPAGGADRLEVVAHGRWRCAVAQPRIAAQPGGTRLDGQGDGVGYLRLEAGVRRISLSHTVWRGGLFRAALLADGATAFDLLAAAPGSYTGVASRRVAETGVHALVVEAAGAWTATVA